MQIFHMSGDPFDEIRDLSDRDEPIKLFGKMVPASEVLDFLQSPRSLGTFTTEGRMLRAGDIIIASIETGGDFEAFAAELGLSKSKAFNVMSRYRGEFTAVA